MPQPNKFYLHVSTYSSRNGEVENKAYLTTNKYSYLQFIDDVQSTEEFKEGRVTVFTFDIHELNLDIMCSPIEE